MIAVGDTRGKIVLYNVQERKASALPYRLLSLLTTILDVQIDNYQPLGSPHFSRQLPILDRQLAECCLRFA